MYIPLLIIAWMTRPRAVLLCGQELQARTSTAKKRSALRLRQRIPSHRYVEWMVRDQIGGLSLGSIEIQGQGRTRRMSQLSTSGYHDPGVRRPW